MQTWAVELVGICCVTQPWLVCLQRAIQLGACLADPGRGTCWNLLHHPTSALVGPAKGCRTRWNPLCRQTLAGVRLAKGKELIANGYIFVLLLLLLLNYMVG